MFLFLRRQISLFFVQSSASRKSLDHRFSLSLCRGLPAFNPPLSFSTSYGRAWGRYFRYESHREFHTRRRRLQPRPTQRRSGSGLVLRTVTTGPTWVVCVCVYREKGKKKRRRGYMYTYTCERVRVPCGVALLVILMKGGNAADGHFPKERETTGRGGSIVGREKV